MPNLLRKLHTYDGNWRLQIDFGISTETHPTKPYEISRWRSNNFQKRGMTVPESQRLPQQLPY